MHGETRIRVWIVKRVYATKYAGWTDKVLLAQRNIYFSLNATQHPANRFRNMLKRQGIPFEESIELRPPVGAKHGDLQVDHYVFRY